MDEILKGTAAGEHAANENQSHDEASIDDLHQSRINDLLYEALSKTDAWDANCGAAISGLLRFGYRLEKMIGRHLDSAVDPIKSLSQCSYALESYFKSMRQADRFAQLGTRRVGHQGRQNEQKQA